MTKKGFTLIEMLVALAIFTIVILIATSAILTLTRGSNTSHAVLTAINNLDFAIESMARTMRVSEKFYCSNGGHPHSSDPQNQATRDCNFDNAQRKISMHNQDGVRVIYNHNRNDKSLIRRVQGSGLGNLDITAPEVDIESLRFVVIGSDPNDGLQPRITIHIKGRTNITDLKDEDQVEFDLQTSVSARKPDF